MNLQKLPLSLFSLSREVDNFKTSGTQEVFEVEHYSPKLHVHYYALLSDYFPLCAQNSTFLCVYVLYLHYIYTVISKRKDLVRALKSLLCFFFLP